MGGGCKLLLIFFFLGGGVKENGCGAVYGLRTINLHYFLNIWLQSCLQTRLQTCLQTCLKAALKAQDSSKHSRTFLNGLEYSKMLKLIKNDLKCFRIFKNILDCLCGIKGRRPTGPPSHKKRKEKRLFFTLELGEGGGRRYVKEFFRTGVIFH